MEAALQRAMTQLEQASTGSLAIYRGAIGTVLAAARRGAEPTLKGVNELPIDVVAQKLGLDIFNYHMADVLQAIEVLQATNPSPATEIALVKIAQRHAAWLAGVTTNADALEDYEYAVPVLLARLRKADEVADAYAGLLKELHYQPKGAPTNG